MNTRIRGFVKELETFEYGLSCLDHVWDVVFPGSTGKWHRLYVNKYKKTFYVACVDLDSDVIEVPPSGPVGIMDSGWRSSFRPSLSEEQWCELIDAAQVWLTVVRRNWVKAARRVVSEYPLDYRKGIIPHAVVRDLLPGLFRLDRELGIRRSRKMVRLVDEGYFMRDKNTLAATMTANRYFEYCRIAYIASSEKHDPVDTSLTGREMYRQYADGRHGGLLDIEPDSETAFADWIDGKAGGSPVSGHPWEIRRGGNTTHIDLSVYRPQFGCTDGFCVMLRGESFSRMVETIKMFLAIHDAGLPISIANPEAVRERILGQDNVGIIPAYDSPHRANQNFPKEQHVYDITYLKSFGRRKKSLLPFITWEPLPLLRPQQ